MPKINLPPGCAGFADGDRKYLAEKGAGSYVHVDDERALKKLQGQDYASAGLVDAGPEKQFIRDTRKQGKWCTECRKLWHAWRTVCCGKQTVPESEMDRTLPGTFTP